MRDLTEDGRTTLASMTVSEIDARLSKLEADLSAAGLHRPNIAFNIHYIWDTPCLHLEAYRTPHGHDNKVSEWFHVEMDEAASVVFDRVEAFIPTIETPQQVKDREFLKKFSDVIAEAEERNLSVTFTTPLKDLREALTSNLLTHQKG